MPKPKLAIYWAASCGGCDVAILDIEEKILDVAEFFDVVFWPCAMDFKYKDVEAMPDKSITLTLFNGAIRSDENFHLAKLLRQKSVVLCAFGSCAGEGCIPGLANFYKLNELTKYAYLDSPSTVNPEQIIPSPLTKVPEGELTLPTLWNTVRTLGQVVDVDYFIPGCPPQSNQIAAVIAAVIDILKTNKPLPPKGTVLGASEKCCCDECPRTRNVKKITKFVRPFEIIPDPDLCLLEQGIVCCGPSTRAGCGAKCVTAGVPCRGCYGVPLHVRDQGAKMVSAIASVIDSTEPEEIQQIIDTIPDPLGTFYRFTLADSLLKESTVMKSITIDPITRLEGHGKIHLFVKDDGELANCYFQVPELRGFEKFCQGRPVEEMARITTRICGVCPDAHHMAAAKAADAVYGVTIPSAALKLRTLVYNAFFAGDHTTHFYALGGPDFVCGPDAPPGERNILGVIAKVGLDAGKKVIAQRAAGQRIIEIIGGKKVHPVTALPGGMSKRVTKDEQLEIQKLGDQMVEFAKFTIKVFDDVVLANKAYVELILSDAYAHQTYNMGLVDEHNKVTFYDGKVRVVGPDGKEHAKYEPKDYLQYVAEHVEPYSYLKYPYLKKIGWKGFVDGVESGVYKASPLSRLNVSDGMATPLAQAEYERFYATLTKDKSGKTMVHSTLATHWARIVELMQAAETVQMMSRDDKITSDKIMQIPTAIPSEGVGIVEAPRGTLTHHYRTDNKGIVVEANLIVGTTNNNAPITMSIKKAAEGLIKKGSEITQGTLNRIEMAFRAYDPCFGCATHSLPGEMPLEVIVHDADTGEIVQTTRRQC